MLTVRGLTKHFGPRVALADVSLALEAGEFFGLLGPHGAGKSTLLALVAGLHAADSGEIHWQGKPLQHADFGYVPHDLALYVDMTAEENLRIFGALYGLRGRLLRERVADGLRVAQLEKRRQELVKKFSGGTRRCLNLVAAALHRPALLLCDDPVNGADPASRDAIFQFLRRLQAKGTTIVYATTSMEDATRLCARVGLIDHGKLLAAGTSAELLAQLSFTEQIRIARNEATAAQVALFGEFGELTTGGDAYLLSPLREFRLADFYAALDRVHLPHRLITVQRPTLENVFFHLTGRSLRNA